MAETLLLITGDRQLAAGGQQLCPRAQHGAWEDAGLLPMLGSSHQHPKLPPPPKTFPCTTQQLLAGFPGIFWSCIKWLSATLLKYHIFYIGALAIQRLGRARTTLQLPGLGDAVCFPRAPSPPGAAHCLHLQPRGAASTGSAFLRTILQLFMTEMPDFNIHADSLEITVFNNRKLKGKQINRNTFLLHTVLVHLNYSRHPGDLYLSRCLHHFYHHGIQAALKSLKIELIEFSPYFCLSSFQEKCLIHLWLYFIYSFVCETG